MSFSISEARSLFSSVLDLYKKGANLEAEQKLLELREAFFSLKEENLDLKEQLQELKEEMKILDDLSYEEPFYFTGEGDNRDGPFCQKCFDVDKILVRLIPVTSMKGSHKCKNCENYYGEGTPPRF